MNIRIGQNTAGAAGASLMDMANFLRANEQNAAAQQERADTRGQNLIDRMARQQLERERMEAEASKAAAEAKAKSSQDESFKLFQADIAAKPQATPAERAQMALARGVTGDDRAKNYLAADLGAGRFGESQAEKLRNGERFSDTMKLKREKLDQDRGFVQARLKQNAEQYERSQDERERAELERERIALLNIGNKQEALHFSMLKTNGYDVNDNNYVGLKRELADMETEYKRLSDSQIPMMPDYALNQQIQNLADDKTKLKNALIMYENKAGKSQTAIVVDKHSERNPAPASAPSKPKAGLRKATIEDF